MINPMNLIQMLRSGGNPQQMIMNMMRQNAGSNPVMNNALQMAEKGDTKGLENLARNLCKERNINPDDAIKQIASQLGVK